MRSQIFKRARNLANSSQVSSRTFSNTSSLEDGASRSLYDRTLPNLKLTSSTRVIFQGLTGRQATTNATESIEWGTNLVGGVKPGFTGEHLGLPVYPSVRKAMEELKPDATGIYVASHQAAAAIEEAIEAEVPLVVAVAEHIPLHDILRIHSMLQTQIKTRLVGANAPGIISPIAKCRIGFQPLSTFSPGPVGIVAKSGTLSYETVASVTRAGVGQSLCIGMGGDVVAGTDFVDALKVFEHDEDTEGIIIVGEVGGTAEEEAAEWIKEYRQRTSNPKPIAALVGGMCAQAGEVMGHAGAWQAPGEGSATDKWNALEKAGCVMVDHPAKFGIVMKELLKRPGSSDKASPLKLGTQQSRGFHTHHRLQRVTSVAQSRIEISNRRFFNLDSIKSRSLLANYNIAVLEIASNPDESLIVGITIARSARSPCVLVSPTSSYDDAVQIPFSYSTGPSALEISEAITQLGLRRASSQVRESLDDLIANLWKVFSDNKAITVSVSVVPEDDSSSPLVVSSPIISLDPASPTNTESSTPADGIVYISLPDPSASIGTLVNGAGLAMNTCDALTRRGLSPTNFLDTGGKATSETVAKSFQMVLNDERVKVLFVNIFGGLTKGDMIAKGILQAFEILKDQGGVRVPVVVRIRGTREKEGQDVITESNLDGVFAYDAFEDAVEKIKELLHAT